jgi:hypothetical protein
MIIENGILVKVESTDIQNGHFYVPKGVTEIGSRAFAGQINLTHITLPDGLDKLRTSAFFGCTNLTHINFPPTFYLIGALAFSGCTNLTIITLPQKINYIAKSAFDGCVKLKLIIIDNDDTDVIDYVKMQIPQLQDKVITKSECIEKTKQSSCIVNELHELTTTYKENLDIESTDYIKTNSILTKLISLLDEDIEPQVKINNYYGFLAHCPNGQNTLSNLEIIKKDTSQSSANFCKGIAVIAAIIITGVLPGLLLSGVVYALTGRHPLDFFKTNSEKYQKDLYLLREKHCTFFKDSPLTTKEDNIQLHETCIEGEMSSPARA